MPGNGHKPVSDCELEKGTSQYCLCSEAAKPESPWTLLIPHSALRTPHSAMVWIALSAKNRLHGYIAVHQPLTRLQTGYTPVTRLHRCPSAT